MQFSLDRSKASHILLSLLQKLVCTIHLCTLAARHRSLQLSDAPALQGTTKRWDQVTTYVRTRPLEEVVEMVKHGLKSGKMAPKQNGITVAKKRQVNFIGLTSLVHIFLTIFASIFGFFASILAFDVHITKCKRVLKQQQTCRMLHGKCKYTRLSISGMALVSKNRPIQSSVSFTEIYVRARAHLGGVDMIILYIKYIISF